MSLPLEANEVRLKVFDTDNIQTLQEQFNGTNSLTGWKETNASKVIVAVDVSMEGNATYVDMAFSIYYREKN